MADCPPLHVCVCMVNFLVILACYILYILCDLVAQEFYFMLTVRYCTRGNPPHERGENFLFVRRRHRTMDFSESLLDVLAIPKYGN
jgi:hypothetical protein